MRTQHNQCFIRQRGLPLLLCGLFVLLASCATTSPPVLTPSAAVIALQRQAGDVAPLVKQNVAREFLKGAAALRTKGIRVVYTRAKDRTSVTPEAFAALKADDQVGFEKKEHSDEFYYSTYYGSPVAYVRALDVAGSYGLSTLNGAKILDIGYGAIGGMRMLAGAGAQVSAVDIDSLLPALYREPVDQGSVIGFDGRIGSIKLFDGVYAGSTTLTKLIGGEFNLIVTKNTMKNGFMKPQSGRKAFVDFGATD
ncbi:MAG: hypothetical protein ACRDAM_16390, partial [Casimicrobium sp.]